MSAEGSATPATPAGSPGVRPKQHFPCFDGFRAIAATTVLIGHVSFASGFSLRNDLVGPYMGRLDIGVVVFFLISGFLLYRPFVAAHLSATPGPATRPYLWRRALRIYPAYWLALTVIVYVFHVGHIADLREFVLFYTLTHAYAPNTFLGPIAQAWTLSAEVAFYVFLPIWAVLVSRGTGSPERRMRVQMASLAALFLASVAYKVVVLEAGLGTSRTAQLLGILPAWLDVFAVGMALAAASTWNAQRSQPAPARLDRNWAPLVCWGLGALAYVVVARGIGLPRAFVPYTLFKWMGGHYLYALAAFFFLLPGIFGPQDRGLIRAFLRNRVMVFLGLVSYGIYLWHELWIDRYLHWTDHLGLRGFTTPFLPMLFAVFALSVAVAAASYFGLERPVSRLKDHPFVRRVRSEPTG